MKKKKRGPKSPQVNVEVLQELEEMGFSKKRAKAILEVAESHLAIHAANWAMALWATECDKEKAGPTPLSRRGRKVLHEDSQLEDDGAPIGHDTIRAILLDRIERRIETFSENMGANPNIEWDKSLGEEPPARGKIRLLKVLRGAHTAISAMPLK